MCDKLCPITGPRTGWKVVAYKPGDHSKYFSPATGIEYPMDGPIIPPAYVREDYRLCTNFANILDPTNGAYLPDYQGFTSVFINKFHALEKAKNWSCNIQVDYEIAIIKAEISNEPFIGEYGIEAIYCGKNIHFFQNTFIPISFRTTTLHFEKEDYVQRPEK